jgi:hypothetical protein
LNPNKFHRIFLNEGIFVNNGQLGI